VAGTEAEAAAATRSSRPTSSRGRSPGELLRAFGF
jgi:hypothetical protein